jgi:hypothetical protein
VSDPQTPNITPHFVWMQNRDGKLRDERAELMKRLNELSDEHAQLVQDMAAELYGLKPGDRLVSKDRHQVGKVFVFQKWHIYRWSQVEPHSCFPPSCLVRLVLKDGQTLHKGETVLYRWGKA